MKKEKSILVESSTVDLNRYLIDGWSVKMISSGHGERTNATFLVILEKED